MKRVQWIDSARFLAMFWILIGHYLATFYPAALTLWEPGPWWWLLGGFPGKLAFSLYFVLLGYFASSTKAFSVPGFARYTLRRYLQLAFFGFLATLLFILGGYAVTWVFHQADESVFRILSDGPRYNLIYLLRDGFLLEDHYIDSFWCMPHLLLASLICRLYGYLPEHIRPLPRCALLCALIALLLVLNPEFFIWVVVALMGCLLRLAIETASCFPLLEKSGVRLLILLLSILVLKIPIEEGPLLFFIEGTVDSIWMLLLSRNLRAQDLLSRSPLPWLGGLTMGIFVIHTPVYALLDSSLIPLLRRILPDAVVLPLFFLPAVGFCTAPILSCSCMPESARLSPSDRTGPGSQICFPGPFSYFQSFQTSGQ